MTQQWAVRPPPQDGRASSRSPGGFFPAQLAGLSFLFDARAGVTAPGNTFSSWVDQVQGGNLNSKGGAAAFPTFASAGGPNGLPSANFSGTASILNAAFQPMNTAASTLFLVLNLVATGTGFAAMVGGNSAFAPAMLGGVRDYRTGGDDLQAGAATFGTYQAWTQATDGTNKIFRVNGAQVGANALAPNLAPTAGVSISGSPTAANPLNMQLSLFFGYSRLLSNPEIAMVEGYLRSLTALW